MVRQLEQWHQGLRAYAVHRARSARRGPCCPGGKLVGSLVGTRPEGGRAARQGHGQGQARARGEWGSPTCVSLPGLGLALPCGTSSRLVHVEEMARELTTPQAHFQAESLHLKAKSKPTHNTAGRFGFATTTKARRAAC